MPANLRDSSLERSDTISQAKCTHARPIVKPVPAANSPDHLPVGLRWDCLVPGLHLCRTSCWRAAGAPGSLPVSRHHPFSHTGISGAASCTSWGSIARFPFHDLINPSSKEYALNEQALPPAILCTIQACPDSRAAGVGCGWVKEAFVSDPSHTAFSATLIQDILNKAAMLPDAKIERA